MTVSKIVFAFTPVHYPGFDVYFQSLCSDPQYSASELPDGYLLL